MAFRVCQEILEWVEANSEWPPIDVFGHHHAACWEAGVLGKRGFRLDCELLTHSTAAGWRSLWRGAQVAIVTTVVPCWRNAGRKQPTQSSLGGRARLVVAAEVGRGGTVTRSSGLSPTLQDQRHFLSPWSAILACTAARVSVFLCWTVVQLDAPGMLTLILEFSHSFRRKKVVVVVVGLWLWLWSGHEHGEERKSKNTNEYAHN